ncbi:hypothetical protein N8009_03515 [Flavobacteriaceae bacterium]|nr:hypothetical protein [Flavobacteriaceae bacterium]
MNITKQLAFLYSLFFLLIIVEPTLELLQSNDEVSTVVITLEQETETKDIEDVKEFAELDFDKTHFINAHLFRTGQTLLFVFYNTTLSEMPLENTSPPPKLI